MSRKIMDSTNRIFSDNINKLLCHSRLYKYIPSNNFYKGVILLLHRVVEKQGDYKEVIRLSKEAKEMGWEGDWDKRIERCLKRLNK